MIEFLVHELKKSRAEDWSPTGKPEGGILSWRPQESCEIFRHCGWCVWGKGCCVSLNQAGRQNKLKSKSKTNMLFQHIICVCVRPTRNYSLRLQIILICKCITNAECEMHYCIHIFSRLPLHFQGDQVNGQIYPRPSSEELIWISLIYLNTKSGGWKVLVFHEKLFFIWGRGWCEDAQENRAPLARKTSSWVIAEWKRWRWINICSIISQACNEDAWVTAKDLTSIFIVGYMKENIISGVTSFLQAAEIQKTNLFVLCWVHTKRFFTSYKIFKCDKHEDKKS